MPFKDVRVRMSVFGSDKAKRDIEDVNASGEKFAKQRFVATLGLDQDSKSKIILKDFSAKLHEVTDKLYTASLGANDDKAKATLIGFELRLKKYAESVSNASIGLDGEKAAYAQILKLNAELDKFGHKDVTANVHVKVHENRLKAADRAVRASSGGFIGRGGAAGLKALLGFGAGGAGAVGAGAGPVSSAASSNPYTSAGAIAGIGALVTAALAILPSIAGTTVGLGVAGLGAGGALALGKHGATVVGADRAALNQAKQAVASAKAAIGKSKTGGTRSQKLSLQQAQQQQATAQGALSGAKNMYGSFLPLNKDLTKLETTGLKTFASAVSPLAKALGPIMGQFGSWIKSMGPALRDMFKASIPFLRMFVNFMERAGKVLIPAFTVAMRAMAPAIPMMTQGLIAVLKGLAQFLKVLGPSGMRASAYVFLALMKLVGAALHGIGDISKWVAEWIAGFIKGMLAAWHSVLPILKNTWKGLVAAAKVVWRVMDGQDEKPIFKAVANFFMRVWDDVSSFLKSTWHGFQNFLGTAWGALKSSWHDVGSFVKRIWADVTGFFKSLWNGFWGFLKGAWSDLRGTFHSTVGFLKGLWSDLTGFFKSLWKGFWSFLSGAWTTLRNTWNSITGAVKSAWHSVETFLSASWNRTKGVATSVWGEIKHIIGTVGAFIINDVWDPFAHAINAGLSFLKIKGSLPTPTVHMAEGGIVPGPKIKADIIPAMLTPGERVLSLGQVSALGGHSAIDSMVGSGSGGPWNFSGGGTAGHGVSGTVQGGQPGGGGGIGSILGDITSLGGRILHAGESAMLNLINKLSSLTGSLLGHLAGGTPFGSSGFANMAVGIVKQVMKEVMASVTASAQAKLGGSGGTQGLKNPLRKIHGLTPERIDMGVDYAGSGPIFAIGGGTITNTNNAGWPGGAFISEKLDSTTAYPGKYVYFAENIRPRVHKGQKVGVNTVIGDMINAPPHIEAGWAAPPGSGLALGRTQFNGSNVTAYGYNFAKLLHALGAPMGIGKGPGTGKVNGYYSPSAGGSAVSGNYLSIGRALMGRGFTKAAAAGITGDIAGESGGNPESKGSGGGGLIGWTPISSAYPIRNIITGHPQADMAAQLTDLVAYVKRNGSIGDMNKYTNPVSAADHFSVQYERPAVRYSDVRASVANSVFKRLANGGMINEPVFGLGMRTGASYSFGENEPEMVTPMRNLPGGGGGGDIIYITVKGDTDPDAAAVRIHQKLRRLKRHKGNQKLGLD